MFRASARRGGMQAWQRAVAREFCMAACVPVCVHAGVRGKAVAVLQACARVVRADELARPIQQKPLHV